MILHTYWPSDRPQDLKTREIDAPTVHAALPLVESWWNHPIGPPVTTTRDLDGRLRRAYGTSVVTLDGGYSLLWHHVTYEAEVSP